MSDQPISSGPIAAGPLPDSSLLSRREVLVRGALTTTALAVGGSLLAGCSNAKEDHPLVTTGVVNLGPAQDYPAGTVSTKYQIQYGIVLTNESGTVLAIRPKCTHFGCIVAWNEEKNQFVCPCHGSRYSILGQVTHGPAHKPLLAITTVKAADGTLTVDLGAIYPPKT